MLLVIYYYLVFKYFPLYNKFNEPQKKKFILVAKRGICHMLL